MAARSHRVSTLAGSGTAGLANGAAAAGLHDVSSLTGAGRHGFANGPAAGAEFRGPYAVAVDADGRVYVADLLGQRIRTICCG